MARGREDYHFRIRRLFVQEIYPRQVKVPEEETRSYRNSYIHSRLTPPIVRSVKWTFHKEVVVRGGDHDTSKVGGLRFLLR